MGYDSATIGELCYLRSGGTPSRQNPAFYGGEIPWVKIGDLDTPSGIVTSTEERITEEGLAAIGNRVFDVGTVLFAMYASVGKTAIAGVRLATNQAILGIVPKDPEVLDPRYLRQWFRFAQSSLSAYTNEGTQKNLSATLVRDFAVPLPPIEEQRRIANLLDEADGVQRLRKEANEKAQRILPALFIDMFGDPEMNPMGWDTKPLGELMVIDSKLVDPTATEYADLLFVGGENIESLTGRIVGAGACRDARQISGKYLFAEDHLLYSKIRPYLNKVAFPRVSGLCSADIYPIRAVEGQTTPEFLIGLLRTPAFLRYASTCSERLRIPKLNREELFAFTAICPPPEAQKRFSELAVSTQILLKREGDATERFDHMLTTLRSRLFAEAV